MFSSSTFLVFVSVAVTFVWALFNCLKIDEQGWVFNLTIIYQITSMIILLIYIALFTPKFSSPEFVFGSFENETNI